MRLGGNQTSPLRGEGITTSLIPSVMLVVLIGMVGAAVGQVLDALEARRIESAAVETSQAAYTVATVEVIQRRLPPNLANRKRTAVAFLEGDLSLALSTLPPEQVTEAELLRDQIIENAQSADRLPRDVADGFLGITQQSAELATAEAADAERNAIRFVLIACLTGILAIGMLFISRRRGRELRDTLRHQATTDHLTGLPNRRGLEMALADAAAGMRRTGTMTGFLYLDLDGFKAVNDTLGHAAGDELLTATADRLARSRATDETLLRLGGDEFAVVLHRLDAPERADEAAARYLAVLDAPCEIHGRLEFLRSSIGVAVTADPDGVGDLHGQADMAMYEAKRSGGQRIERFRPALREESDSVSATTRALRNAWHDDEFEVAYQAVLTADGTDTLFVEALARWTSPELGPVSPGVFIPIAETTGEIHPLGSWMVRNVIDQLVAWDAHPDMAGVSASCNVSPLQFTDAGFADFIIDALHIAGVDPHRLIIEVTESAALDASGDAIAAIERLKGAGLRIAIDDFGSGYSNLGELFDFPFDILKLDRGLLLQLDEMRLRGGDGPRRAHAIMSSICAISRQLGADIVCEGVETVDQQRFLLGTGVTHIQGFLFARPTSPSELAPPRLMRLAS